MRFVECIDAPEVSDDARTCYNASMANPKDVEGTRFARRMFTKFKIDVTKADVRCMHGVVYLRGQITAYRDSGITDLRAEVEKIARVLRTQPGIRDVSIDVSYRQ